MLVSIIIPCFNVEKYVRDSIESALKQSYQNIELILVDNHSTDQTLEILKEYQLKYPTLIVLSEEQKPGAPATRNKGLSLAKGEWIQFLDADDRLLEDKIQNQVLQIQKSLTPLDFIAGSYRFEMMNGMTRTIVAKRTEPWVDLVWSSIGNTCTNLWKKSTLESIGGWNEKMKSSQEYDLMFRLLANGATFHIDTQLATVVRQRVNSISTSEDQAGNYRRCLDLSLEILQHIRTSDLGLSKASRQRIEQGVLLHLIRLGQYDFQEACTVYRQTFTQKNAVDDVAFSRIFRSLYTYTNYPIAQFGFNFYRKMKKYIGLEHYKLPLP